MRIVLLLALLLALPAGATDVYRWVDSSGQAHYSDQWQPGAEKLRITDAPGFSTPKAGTGSGSGTAAAGKQAAAPAAPATKPRYELLEIVSPAQQEVLWNIAGQVRVSMRVSPELQPGNHLRLYLDGVAQDLPEGSTETQLQDVYRGVHTLKAEVIGKNEAVLGESEPTTFVVRQTSIATP